VTSSSANHSAINRYVQHTHTHIYKSHLFTEHVATDWASHMLDEHEDKDARREEKKTWHSWTSPT